MQYICVGKEIGKVEKTPHLQGYLYLHNPAGLKKVREFAARAHWLKSYGSAKQASEYCKKEGDWWEMGEMPQQGARLDLKEVAEQVRNGASLEEVAEESPAIYVRYTKGLTALMMSKMTDRTEKPEVSWLWGETGSGKTRTAVECRKSFYIKDSSIWWDGYTQQECIIIDDFDGKWNFRDLLRLLDRYPYQGQCKGGYIKINSPIIFITCEYPPQAFWKGSELDQILRRVTTVRECIAQK